MNETLRQALDAYHNTKALDEQTRGQRPSLTFGQFVEAWTEGLKLNDEDSRNLIDRVVKRCRKTKPTIRLYANPTEVTDSRTRRNEGQDEYDRLVRAQDIKPVGKKLRTVTQPRTPRLPEIAEEMGITKEQLYARLQQKANERAEKKAKLSAIADAAANMIMDDMYPGETLAAKALKDQPNHEKSPQSKVYNVALNVELPKPNVQWKAGRATYPKNGVNTVGGDKQWSVNLKSPKRPVQTNDPRSSYTGAI
jgi:hypothetical protein